MQGRDIVAWVYQAWVCHFFALKYKGVVYLQKKMFDKGETSSLHYSR